MRQSKRRSRLWLVLILSLIVVVLSTSGYLLSMLPGYRPVVLGEWVGVADSRPITSDTPHPAHERSGNSVVRVTIRRKILSLVPSLKGEVEIADDRGSSQRFMMHTFATPPPAGDWTLSAALDAPHQETHLFAAKLSPHDSLWIWTRGFNVETVGMLQRGGDATYRELVSKLSSSHQ